MTERNELADRSGTDAVREMADIVEREGADKFTRAAVAKMLRHCADGIDELRGLRDARSVVGDERADDDCAAIIRKQGCKMLDLCDALRPFVALLDAYEAALAGGDVTNWAEYVTNVAWPSEQDCINARIALTGGE